MLDFLLDPLAYSFMQRALLASVLVGGLCAIVGCYVVLRGMAFLGDALAHIILPGVVVAFLIGWPLAVGALLTLALYRAGELALLPAVWLLLYGTAVMSCGTYSVRVVPIMGAAFMTLGSVALLVSWPWAQLCLAAGFGGLQTMFGIVIARKYGG